MQVLTGGKLDSKNRALFALLGTLSSAPPPDNIKLFLCAPAAACWYSACCAVARRTVPPVHLPFPAKSETLTLSCLQHGCHQVDSGPWHSCFRRVCELVGLGLLKQPQKSTLLISCTAICSTVRSGFVADYLRRCGHISAVSQKCSVRLMSDRTRPFQGLSEFGFLRTLGMQPYWWMWWLWGPVRTRHSINSVRLRCPTTLYGFVSRSQWLGWEVSQLAALVSRLTN